MVNVEGSVKRAELEFKKEAWMQAMNDIKTAAHFWDIIISKKIQTNSNLLSTYGKSGSN